MRRWFVLITIRELAFMHTRYTVESRTPLLHTLHEYTLHKYLNTTWCVSFLAVSRLQCNVRQWRLRVHGNRKLGRRTLLLWRHVSKLEYGNESRARDPRILPLRLWRTMSALLR